ncbi:MAG: hypothetical protein LUB63_05685, partial [Oscillospiraceae bacterium]|nr:hypothetical protein [Oscillospiraceae bacterium]
AKRVTGRDVKDLFIKELCIKAVDADKFRKGQSSWIYKGNKLPFTEKPANKPRFKGDMQGATLIGDTYYALEVKIGNIDFDISVQYESAVGDTVIFENVSATIYPVGQYSVKIMIEE